MRIPWGFHRGKRTEDLTEQQLVSLQTWMESVDNWTPRQLSKEVDPLTRAIAREVEQRREDAAEDEERAAEASGPRSPWSRLSASAAKLYVTLGHLLERNGWTQPFPASRQEIQALAGHGLGSNSTFASAKRELEDLGLLVEPTRGDFRLLPKSTEPALSHPFLLYSLFLLEAKELQEGRDGADYVLFGTTALERAETIREGVRILGNPDGAKDDEIRFARAKLMRMLSLGHTLADALKVCRWARQVYNTGEERFSPLLDLVYLWTTPRFAGYLNAANSKPVRKEYHVGGMEDPTDPGVVAYQKEREADLRAKGHWD